MQNKNKVDGNNDVDGAKVILRTDSAADGMENSGELQKGRSHIIIEIVEYMPNAVVSKTIIKKATGNITAMSFATGEQLEEKISPFDIYVQIIDGAAEVVINENIHHLSLGNGFIIPANSIHRFNANEQFKMILTVIKSGYDI